MANLSRRTALLTAFTCLLTGCYTGVTTNEMLTDEKTVKETIVVNAAPAIVYQRLVLSLRDCFARPPWRVEADFFAATNSGRLTTAVAASAVLTVIVVDISPDANGNSNIRLARRPVDQPLALYVASLAHGQPAKCPI